jgi:hypothetical protein
LVERELGDRQVCRHAGEVEEQQLLPELAPSRLGPASIDVVQVAIVQVDPPPLDLQPGAAVHHAAAPAAEFGDDTRPTGAPHVVDVEVAAVVEREVPVAVRTGFPPSARAAERNRMDAGQRRHR